MSATRNPLEVVQRLIDKALASYCPHRVGELYISMTDADPSKTWPGTSWERITDCFLRAADDEHPAGTTGGAWTHTQTEAEIAAHNPFLPNEVANGWATVPKWGIYVNTQGGTFASTFVGTTNAEVSNRNGWNLPAIGKSRPMDITNKYTAANMWRRTA